MMRQKILASAKSLGVALVPTYRTSVMRPLDEGAAMFVEPGPLCESPKQARITVQPPDADSRKMGEQLTG